MNEFVVGQKFESSPLKRNLLSHAVPFEPFSALEEQLGIHFKLQLEIRLFEGPDLGHSIQFIMRKERRRKA